MVDRPLRADARRNREALLAAAGALFAGEGLGAPLDEIARRAGVGPGTVHRHFPTKEALYAAVAVDHLEAAVAYGRARLDDGSPPAAALRATLERMLAEGEASAPLKSALAGTEFDLRTAAPAAADELRSVVDALLARARDAGGVRADLDVDDVLALVAGAFAALGHAGTTSTTDSGRGARLVDVFFDGLRV